MSTLLPCPFCNHPEISYREASDKDAPHLLAECGNIECDFIFIANGVYLWEFPEKWNNRFREKAC